MKLLYLGLSFCSLTLLDFYLKVNIRGIGEGSLNLQVLALFFVLGGGLVLWRAGLSRLILVRRSILLLACFFAYFTVRIGFDTGSVEEIKAYLIATTGGVFLFYLLGTMVSISIDQHQKYSLRSYDYFKFFAFFLLLYSCFTYTLLLSIFFDFTAKLRSDIFLIKGLNEGYQRSGDFLVIGYLILISLYVQFYSLKQIKNSIFFRGVNIIVFTLLVINALTSMVIAQMMGSNKAVVLLAGLVLILTSVSLLLQVSRIQRYLAIRQLTFYRFISGKIAVSLFTLIVILFFFLVLFVIVSAGYIGVDLAMTRLAGFGSHEISSVTSRLTLLDNFILHFSYSPVFGNMQVDCLTTGCGTYVHSFVGSSLTHTGIVGFFLLLGYFFLAYKERFETITVSYGHPKFLLSNILNLYSVLFISAVLLIAIVGTFISWSVLWFSMGLYLNAVKFKEVYE
ncbi:hypothetical protein [uncultured Endozoicomonas sp.]|uniref:hypothetical protein n=1 Tax=uncultured Endozoicomonas sp. TaxID=432652 RepID=UPI002606A59B|nr:hypothetical protein [uncultured Endozoicomonas sp.]